jgi:uncharacterized protein (TIGR02284 family)
MKRLSEENASKVISNLIKNSFEMVDFYTRVYNKINDEDLKQIIKYNINKRTEIIDELKSEGKKFNSSLDKLLTSFREKNHNAAIYDNEDVSIILHECEKNEDESEKIYESAVKENLSPKLKWVISKQYGDIKQAHYHIRLLWENKSN